jgi:hypothetical protein
MRLPKKANEMNTMGNKCTFHEYNTYSRTCLEKVSKAFEIERLLHYYTESLAES